jgi:hypothetical protein
VLLRGKSGAIMVARDMGNDASSGTLTFVFTDLQSSTRLWETFPDAMKDAMERHDSSPVSAAARTVRLLVRPTRGAVVRRSRFVHRRRTTGRSRDSPSDRVLALGGLALRCGGGCARWASLP